MESYKVDAILMLAAPLVLLIPSYFFAPHAFNLLFAIAGSYWAALLVIGCLKS